VEAAAEAAAAAGALRFPSRAAPAANALALHPRVRAAAAQLLGADDLRLAEVISYAMEQSGYHIESLYMMYCSTCYAIIPAS
jgi:hypothetical protein